MLRPRVLESKLVFEGPVFSVTKEEVIEPSGVRVRRDTVRHQGSVVLLAVDESSGGPRILLARQYRHPANAALWELPAGRIDRGENSLAAAKRELIEETGFRARQWKRILFFYSSPGFLDETMTVYLARGLEAGEAAPEEDEVIGVRFFSLERALQMAERGAIRDGKTLAAVYWLARHLPGAN